MDKTALAKLLYEALTSQPGDGISPEQRTSDEGFGFQAADGGKTVLEGSYDLAAVAEAIIADRSLGR